MPTEKGWIDITDRLGLEKTFGRRVVMKEIPGEHYPFMRMAVPDGIQVIGFDTEGLVIAITETRKDTGEMYCHLVGGTVDKDETPEIAAEREFLEETGYRVGNLLPLGALHKDSAHLQGATFAYLATDCIKMQEPEEGASVKLMTFDEFERMLYEYVSSNPRTPRSGGNSVITAWLARQRFNTQERSS